MWREISRRPESADAMMGLPSRRSQIRKRLTCSARLGISSDERERPISQRSTRFHFSEKVGSFSGSVRSTSGRVGGGQMIQTPACSASAKRVVEAGS